MCPDASMGTETTNLGLKASMGGRGQDHSGGPPGPRDVQLCCLYPTPQGKGHGKEAGEKPAQALAGWVTDDPSVTLAALVGRGPGSSARTLEILGVLYGSPCVSGGVCPSTLRHLYSRPQGWRVQKHLPSQGKGKNGGPQLGTEAHSGPCARRESKESLPCPVLTCWVLAPRDLGDTVWRFSLQKPPHTRPRGHSSIEWHSPRTQ